MRIKVSIHSLYLFITFTLLVINSSRVLSGTRMGTIVEMTAYMFLLGGIGLSYMNLGKQYKHKFINMPLFVISVLLCVGILIQRFAFQRMILLLFTMVAVILPSIMAEHYIKKWKDFRTIAYAITCGAFIDLILALVSGVPITMNSVEASFGIHWSYNGGIVFKNVATVLLSIIICLESYRKCGGRIHLVDKILLVGSLLGIVLSNSRGAWVITLAYVLSLNYEIIKYIGKKYRLLCLFTLAVTVVLVGVYTYRNIFSNSGTYMFRVRGWVNYINMYRSDYLKLFFGNGKIAYDQGTDYATAIRSVTGWNGSVEIAWLDILIKNGIIGLIGFVIIFARAFLIARSSLDMKIKSAYIAVMAALLLSTFAATYIQNVHQFYGIFSYTVMSFFAGRIHNERVNLNRTSTANTA